MESGVQFAGKTESHEGRKGDMSYLESVKTFDSWPSGGRSPLNELAKCKVAMDMQSCGFWHVNSVQKHYPSSIPEFVDIQNIV